MIRTAKAWKVRPSELLNQSDDPYVAYCFDSACAFLMEQIVRGHMPKFPNSSQNDESEKRTTNSAIIAEMQKSNKIK